MRLSEDDSVAITVLCDEIRTVGVSAAAHLAVPLTTLDYQKMDQSTIGQVEDALFYAMTGSDRSVHASASSGGLLAVR